MTREKPYNTKQKDLILKIIKEQENKFIVKDIYNELNESVGLTTIYRLIDKLVSEDIITKNIGNDNVTYYQYLEQCNHENHFYLKCDKCGLLVHIDCDCISDLTSHILKKHNFKPSKKHIIINGVCSNCEVEVV